MSFTWPGRAHDGLRLGLHLHVAPAAGDTISFKARKKNTRRLFWVFKYCFFLKGEVPEPSTAGRVAGEHAGPARSHPSLGR